MVSKAKFITEMKRIGVSIDEDDPFTMYLDAPPGYEWVSTGTTVLSVPFASVHGDSWVRDAIKRALHDVTPGITKITDEDKILNVEHERDEPWRCKISAPALIKPFETQ